MIDKEILASFRDSSIDILKELVVVAEKIGDAAGGDGFPVELLQEFAQKIDRIMGVAKTIAMEDPGHEGLKRIATLTELCKFIGYKAADQKNARMLPIFAAFLGDVVSAIEELTVNIENPAAAQEVTKTFLPVLQKRLEWLKTKVASTPGQPNSQADVDALLKKFSK
ncbi:MAG: hypothetical protein HY075_13520 [Deltaproteobacteria bacterium]|nr:hypothetical protein [Deltaproteobacteria bacterium]